MNLNQHGFQFTYNMLYWNSWLALASNLFNIGSAMRVGGGFNKTSVKQKKPKFWQNSCRILDFRMRRPIMGIYMFEYCLVFGCEWKTNNKKMGGKKRKHFWVVAEKYGRTCFCATLTKFVCEQSVGESFSFRRLCFSYFIFWQGTFLGARRSGEVQKKEGLEASSKCRQSVIHGEQCVGHIRKNEGIKKIMTFEAITSTFVFMG